MSNTSEKRILYLECTAGISGDMMVGSLLHLGMPFDYLKSELDKLNVGAYILDAKIVQKCGISGIKFDVLLEDERHPSQVHHHHDEHHSHDPHSHDTKPILEKSIAHHHAHRNFQAVSEIINTSSLSDEIKRLSTAIFKEVAQAEAIIHNKAIEDVHFHEVGAVDSIIDIVSTAIGIAYHGIDEVMCSPLHVGSGMVRCAHGLLPVPAPATLEILKGIPIYQTEMKGEFVTPTGAAIVKVLCKTFGPMPKMAVERVGYGSGTKDFPIANMVRAIIGKKKKAVSEANTDAGIDSDEVVLLEANIDDQNPEVTASAIGNLLALGALDTWLELVVMKKNRSGVKVCVLCHFEKASLLKEWLLLNTTTFGVRYQHMNRSILRREITKVETCFGFVSVKLGYIGDKLIKVSPEHQDLTEIARIHNVPLLKVERAAQAAIWMTYKV